MKEENVALSKTMAYVLRHNPGEFNLVLDNEGWTEVNELLEAIKRQTKYKDITITDIEKVVATDSKKRYELRDGQIRAVYGHSIKKKIEKRSSEPPTILFHGTTPQAAKTIREHGLKPMSRQYVHLSEDMDTANIVALRRTKAPEILKVRAKEAYLAGVFFSKETNGIWLADTVPPQYIEDISIRDKVAFEWSKWEEIPKEEFLKNQKDKEHYTVIFDQDNEQPPKYMKKVR